LFGTASLGLYSISYRVLGLPLSVISINVAKVFFEDASREYDKTGQFYKAFRKTTLFLVAITIPMVLGMIFIVPPLCGLFFGQSWELAGEYIRILSIMFGFRFVVSSLTPGLLVANKQNYELMLQLLFVVSSVGCFVAAKMMSLPLIGYLVIINISFSLVYAIYFIVIFKCSKNSTAAAKSN
jgi:O-antigen/teichoic acid export membrane protein